MFPFVNTNNSKSNFFTGPVFYSSQFPESTGTLRTVLDNNHFKSILKECDQVANLEKNIQAGGKIVEVRKQHIIEQAVKAKRLKQVAEDTVKHNCIEKDIAAKLLSTPSTPSTSGTSGTPGTPGTPGTSSTPGTPGTPSTRSTLSTLGTPTILNTTNTAGTVSTPVTPDTPSKKAKRARLSLLDT